MRYQITNIPLLRKILWADFCLGAGTAVPGLLWHRPLAGFLGLPPDSFAVIAAVTLLYALLALYLARQQPLSVPVLRTLVFANWGWAVISIGLAIMHMQLATIFGAAFLILQVIVVGGLAYLEGRHISTAR